MGNQTNNRKKTPNLSSVFLGPCPLPSLSFAVGSPEHFGSQLSSQTCQQGLRCGDKAPFPFFLTQKMCLLPSDCRAPSLFYWMFSQGCSRKPPGSKYNTDWFKWVESKGLAGAALDTAWVCEQSYWGETQRNATTELVHSLLRMQRKGKESLQPTASTPGPAALCKEHPGSSDQLICRSASFQRQELTHLCITLHHFSSKTKDFHHCYGRKSPLTSPIFLRLR